MSYYYKLPCFHERYGLRAYLYLPSLLLRLSGVSKLINALLANFRVARR